MSKPRIRKSGRGWVCTSPGGRKGHGVNPQMAYGGWLAVRGQFMPEQYAKRGSRIVRQPGVDGR